MGGTSARYSALLNGALPNGTAVYATILNYPFTVEGESLPEGQAPTILDRVSNVVAPITSSAFTIRELSLSSETESALLTRFLAAMYGANKLLLNSKYKDCAIQAIATQVGITTDVATLEYASVIDTLTGEVSPGNNFTVNQEGIMNDVEVRQSYGGFASVPTGFDFAAALVPGPGKLIDYTIRDAAVALYQSQHSCFNPCKSYTRRRS